MNDMTDKERTDTIMALLYEFRLLIQEDKRNTFTKEELLKLIDVTATIKSQK